MPVGTTPGMRARAVVARATQAAAEMEAESVAKMAAVRALERTNLLQGRHHIGRLLQNAERINDADLVKYYSQLLRREESPT